MVENSTWVASSRFFFISMAPSPDSLASLIRRPYRYISSAGICTDSRAISKVGIIITVNISFVDISTHILYKRLLKNIHASTRRTIKQFQTIKQFATCINPILRPSSQPPSNLVVLYTYPNCAVLSEPLLHAVADRFPRAGTPIGNLNDTRGSNCLTSSLD